MRRIWPFTLATARPSAAPAPASPAQSLLEQAGALPVNRSERGYRPTPEDRLRYLYRLMYVDTNLRAAILDIRDMDRRDPRVKKIHARTAQQGTKGGLKLKLPAGARNKVVHRAWERFEKRLQLDRREKLESDMRGLMMEGNFPIQWVLDDTSHVCAGVRMPSETIVPRVGRGGVFLDPRKAYDQYDLESGAVLASFALYEMTMVRLQPQNFDDQGSLGRPYLDASRSVWKKLEMTEEDLVIRRRTRAPQRFSHVLEGAGEPELAAYRANHESEQGMITTDFYQNKKGGVTALQGDANLDQIADVVHLLDTFFAGAPAPKGLFGYTKDLARDILEDLKRDFYDELDAMQDTLSWAYYFGFNLELLLSGINPDDVGHNIVFAERRTETLNQAADRALKYQALGASKATVFEAANLDAEGELENLADEQERWEPYGISADAPESDVSITPGNARKSESATSVDNG